MKYLLTIIAILLFFAIHSNASASTIVRSPNNTGLVGYWNFDVQAGGSTVYDLSGNANNGTMTNMDPATDWVDGKVGSGALDFLGTSNQYVSVPNSNNWDFLGQNRTVAMWVNIDQYDSSGVALIGRLQGSPVNSSGWTLAVEPTNKVRIYLGSAAGGAWVATSAGTISLDTWYYLAFTKDSSENYQIYINGVADGSGNFSLVDNDLPFVLGDAYSASSNNGWNLDGLIDEARIYNRALSASEIQRLYKATAGTKIAKPALSSGLVGYWNFDVQAGGSTVYDLSGNANNGTMTNMDPATDWVDGKVGSGAMDFDGSNDYVDIGNNTSIKFDKSTNFSWAFWIKPNTITGYQSILSEYNSTNYKFIGLDVVPGAIRFDYAGGADITPAIITANKWQYIVFTHIANTTNYLIYLDGVYNDTLVSTGSGANTNNQLIGISTGNQFPFNGLIDEVRIYNRALSADEVRRLYNLGK